MKTPLRLTPKDRELINWFLCEYIEIDGGPNRDKDKWSHSYHRSAKGSRGWWPIQQGHTGVMKLLYWYHHQYKLGSSEWRPAIIIRAALEVANGVKATEYLKTWLATYHSIYTIDDVAISPCRGYLRCLKPCGGGYPCRNEQHYHTIRVPYIKGFGRGRYAFWRALKAGGILTVESERG